MTASTPLGRMVTTLEPDFGAKAGTTFNRGGLSRVLAIPPRRAATPVFVAAVLALLATSDAEAVRIAVASPGGLVPLWVAVSPRTALAALSATAALRTGDAAGERAADVAVAVLAPAESGLDPAELDQLAYELDWFDLSLTFAPAADAWEVTCSYDADLYAEDTIAAQLDRLDAILARVISGDGARLSDVTGVSRAVPVEFAPGAYLPPHTPTEVARA